MYEYSLDGAAFQSANIYAGLLAGTYNITVRDGNGCTSSCMAIIAEPTALSCTTTATGVTDCGIDDGTITVSAIGGTTGYTYDAGAGTVTANMISGLVPGAYVVTVTDANGCTSLCSAEITGLNIPTCATSNIVNVDCNGNATGSYLVTGMGGNSMAYNFTDGLMTNTDGVFTMLTAGNYTVTISEQDNPMCASTCTLEITEPSVLSCGITLNNNVSCNGLLDGSATVTGTGGTGPYTYFWPNGETAATATMLSDGLHTVTVTDANGCTTTCDVAVNENPVLTCTITETSSILCNGDSTGELTVTGVGGDGVYEYSLDGAAFQSANIYAGLMAGTYNITVRDGNGCTSECTATITEPTVVSCTTTATSVTDCGIDDGTITCLLYTSPSPRDRG